FSNRNVQHIKKFLTAHKNDFPNINKTNKKTIVSDLIKHPSFKTEKYEQWEVENQIDVKKPKKDSTKNPARLKDRSPSPSRAKTDASPGKKDGANADPEKKDGANAD